MNDEDRRRLEELNQLVPVNSQVAHLGGGPNEGDTGKGETEAGPLELLIDRMSGRWKYAIPLALILATAFGIVGYTFAETYYQSSGLIRVAPKITPLVGETIETGAIPNYQGHVLTQARLVRSARVRERALNSLNLDELPWDTRNEAMEAIDQNLDAEADRRSELITVTFRADSPDTAQIVLDAILNAYDELYASAEGEEFIRRMSTLRSNRETLRTEYRQKKDDIQNLISAGEYAVSDFNVLIKQRAMTIEQMETELRYLESTLEQYEARGGMVGLDDLDDLSGEELLTALSIDYRELEAYDPELARIARQREDAHLRFGQAQNRYRPEHRVYAAAQREVESLDRMYQQRAAAIVRDFLNDPKNTNNAQFYSASRVEFMRSEIKHLREKTTTMGQTQLKLDQLYSDLKDIEEQYNMVNERLQLMQFEADAIRSGNISIAAMADRPSAPRQDRRRIFAAIGVMGGIGTGIGFFFLLGSIDRRTYAVTQLKQSEFGKQLLGVLPSLPRKSGDMEAAGIAAHCVHQIRNQIEAVRGRSNTPAIVISSPFQGDGKTSLTLALGASYATAGYRTILVDCDLVGRSLTRHLMMEDKPGLQESLLAGGTNGNARKLNLKNLNILPVGMDAHFGPERIRKEDLERLFSQLRKTYDVVLIDTGPLFGSIESLPVASASDGVVLTMRRGRRVSGLQACIRSLHSVKSSCLGIVLNHAHASDCDQYVSKSKLSALHQPRNGTTKTSDGHNIRRNVLLEAVTTTTHQEES